MYAQKLVAANLIQWRNDDEEMQNHRLICTLEIDERIFFANK